MITTQQDYHRSIVVNTPMSTAFESVQKRVNEWWTPDLEGNSEKPGDEFTVHFGDTFVTFKVKDLILDQKITWVVTDCYLPWLNDKIEWNGTSLIWTFSARDSGVQIDMTHVGLVPEIECYDNCVKGWDFFFVESLYQLLTTGKGMPNQAKSDRKRNSTE